jgi:predicted acyltransferase (DUF342 family)
VVGETTVGETTVVGGAAVVAAGWVAAGAAVTVTGGLLAADWVSSLPQAASRTRPAITPAARR